MSASGRRCSLVLLMAVACSGVARAGIVETKHNLSASGPGEIRAFGEDEVCIFCHAPHNTAPATPLWNREISSVTYTPYSSSTLDAAAGQPSGASKLCLSCHDGTIALGAVLSRPLPIAMSRPLQGRAVLSTDLSDDHPVSFSYLTGLDPELVDPTTLTGSVRLDANAQMQCTSCHDAHSDTYPDFLVVDASFSRLCTECHRPAGWPGSVHEISSATWNGTGIDPWPHTGGVTVAENGCASCHASHGAGIPERLLVQSEQQDNCLSCHAGSVAGENVAVDFQKSSRHRVDTTADLHDPREDLFGMPRHAACQDCHDPHAATTAGAVAPNASGALFGVAGISASGTRIEDSSYEYEVCFGCHADGSQVPLPAIQRQIEQANLRLKFDLLNPSFHPVEGPGADPDVPSLIFPWSSSSILYCTDCHASDDGPGAGGTGATGAHGSIWAPLLEREYRRADLTSESFQAYALCYKCHDRQSILGDTSFREHRKHIVGERSPCSACHDPHGISSAQGNSFNNSHLINFDVTIVSPVPGSGLLRFEDLGDRSGRCYLMCHGERHDPETY